MNEEVDTGSRDSSEVEHMVFLQDGALMKFEVEEDKLLREMSGFEVVEATESTVSEEVVDVVIVVVLEKEAVANEEVTGIANLRVLVIDQVEGSKALSKAQTELG